MFYVKTIKCTKSHFTSLTNYVSFVSITFDVLVMYFVIQTTSELQQTIDQLKAELQRYVIDVSV